MRIINNLDEMTETARGWLAGGSVGFVPTRGHLHAGHMTLVQAAQQECEISVVSIFADPLQAGPGEVAAQQPRDLEHDLQLLGSVNVDIVFHPRAGDMYPADFSTYVTISGPLLERLERVSRPGRQRGIATGTTKLLQLIRPDVAFLGQKDAQEVAVIRQLVRDLNIDVNLRILPTVREEDGLAISSSNILLTPHERQVAPVLYRALLAAKALIEGGERRAGAIVKVMTDMIATEKSIKLYNAAVCRHDTFAELDVVETGTLLVVEAQIGRAYLVDNILWISDGNWLI